MEAVLHPIGRRISHIVGLCEKQIPRGLKPAKNEKIKDFPARLKSCPDTNSSKKPVLNRLWTLQSGPESSLVAAGSIAVLYLRRNRTGTPFLGRSVMLGIGSTIAPATRLI